MDFRQIGWISLNRRALALVVVVATLGVLGLLAAAFVTLARLERRAGQQRLNGTKAFLLARSGIEDALARMQAGQDPDFPVSRFAGADRDADGTVSAVERAAYLNPSAGLAGPVRLALRPSWAVLAAGPSVPAQRASRGYSGILGSGPSGVYVLKASSGGFYVNGGDPSAAHTIGYNAVLKRILGTLAEALDREDAANNGVPVDQSDGEDLVRRRPAEGWKDFDEVASVLGWSSAKAEAFQPYLAFRAWTDKRVISPNVPSALLPSLPKEYGSWGDLVLDRRLAPDGGSRAPDFERMPSGTGRIVGRAPVSFSWAVRHRPALIALIAGLSGVYLDDGSEGQDGARPGGLDAAGNPTDAVGVLRKAEIVNDWDEFDDCHRAVDALQAQAWRVSTWQDFEALTLLRADDHTQAQRDLLKANFNPNSDLNKFNPDRSVWHALDKSDLVDYSTEFSLDPVQPCVVESCGRVMGPKGEVLAERVLTGTVAAPGVVRLSTQREFVCEDLGSLEFPGDETSPRLPGHPRFVSESRGDSRTWGHRLDTRVQMAVSWMDSDSRGASVQSYPEPCHDAGAGLAILPSDADGRISLATVETPSECFYGLEGSARWRDMKMLAGFDDGFDLDVADGQAACRGSWNSAAPSRGDNNLQLVNLTELGHGLFHPTKPTTLRPDGAYSEADRAPGYLDLGNAHGFHGLMSFWVKNNFRYPEDSRGEACLQQFGHLPRGHNYVHWDAYGQGRRQPEKQSQFFFLGLVNPEEGDHGDGIPVVISHFEAGRGEDDKPIERQFRTGPTDPAAHRWRLITCFWDFRAADRNQTGELVLDASESGSPDSYRFWGSPLPAQAEDITRDDADGPHTLFLGRLLSSEVNVGGNPSCGRGADATFDEFGIWDFGGRAIQADATDPSSFTDFLPGSLAQDLAAARWKDGRYYRGSEYSRIPGPLTPVVADQAASWLSAPIALPAGSRILDVAWTFRKAADLPVLAGDYAEVALANLAGDDYVGEEAACRSTLAPGWTPSLHRWGLGGISSGPFRLQVVFRRTVPLAAGVPVLDAPSVDDLTLRYLPPGGLRLLDWRGN